MFINTTMFGSVIQFFNTKKEYIHQGNNISNKKE